MFRLLTVLGLSLVLAYISEKHTEDVHASGRRYAAYGDPAYVLLTVILVLFTGLRTNYNDTQNYVYAFEQAPELSQWLAAPKNFNLFSNPLFYFYQSAMKTLFGDVQLFIFAAALITQVCFLRFFKRYSRQFVFSIFLYFTLGTFVFTLAAIKQVLSMAVITLAVPCMEKKRWGSFYLLVFVAMLIHTYAIIFALLPLFRNKPWSIFTFVFIAVTAAVMMNFETAITDFIEQANDLGKTLAEYEIFDNVGINAFRLAVYAVPPLLSLFFYRWVMAGSNEMDNVMIHMSIVSLAFMCMGTKTGANMFGRMANYFELGTICCLPAMLHRTFNKRSYTLVSAAAWVCFFGFFFYANAINKDFGQEYRAISLWTFLFS